MKHENVLLFEEGKIFLKNFLDVLPEPSKSFVANVFLNRWKKYLCGKNSIFSPKL